MLLIKDQDIKMNFKIFIKFYFKTVVSNQSISIFAAAFQRMLFENFRHTFPVSVKGRSHSKNILKKFGFMLAGKNYFLYLHPLFEAKLIEKG